MGKLSSSDSCSNDRSPFSDVPTKYHYATQAMWMNENTVGVSLKVYSTTNNGWLSLCYAVNDYAEYRSTQLSIRVPRQVFGPQTSSLISAEMNWISGSSNQLQENATQNYVEYELELSRELKSGEYIR